MSRRYDVVRLAYAGESIIERRSVVNEDGKLERVNWEFEGFGGGFGPAFVEVVSTESREGNRRRGLPMPMFSYLTSLENRFASLRGVTHTVHQSMNGLPLCGVQIVVRESGT